MGSPSQICQRVATALSQGQVVLLPSDGLYMAMVSPAHCQSRAKLDELCKAPANAADADPELTAFVRAQPDLREWGLPLPACAKALASKFWPGSISFIYAPTPESPLPEDFAKNPLEVCKANQSFMCEVLDALAPLMPNDTAPLLIGRPAHHPGQLPVSSGRWLAQSLGETKVSDLLDQVAFVIDAGPTKYGCLPTALQVDEKKPVLVRRGPVSVEEIEAVLEQSLEQALVLPDASYGQLSLVVSAPAKAPSRGLEPVQALASDAWAIGVGPRPKNCPKDRWIELYETPDAFVAEYFDALAQASEAGAKTVYLRVPTKDLADRLGLNPS